MAVCTVPSLTMCFYHNDDGTTGKVVAGTVVLSDFTITYANSSYTVTKTGTNPVYVLDCSSSTNPIYKEITSNYTCFSGGTSAIFSLA